MASIFVSYNRESEVVAGALARDLESLGHSVWFDQQLSGGQAWWDQILASVRKCDVFVFVLSPESLNSVACQREYGYAAALGRPVMPVLVSGEVSTNLLPPALSQIQFVDYRKQDRDAAFRLARALAVVPPAKSLPDPLPASPEAPISYLGGLTAQLESKAVLSFEEQSALLIDLRRGFRDPATAADSRTLLAKLRRRRDLLAAIAEEIDDLLGPARQAPPAPPPAPQAPPQRLPTPSELRNSPPPLPPSAPGFKPTRRDRLRGAAAVGIVGAAFGAIGMATSPRPEYSAALVPGILCAIAGLISGTRRRDVIVTLIGAAAGCLLNFSVLSSDGAPAAEAFAIGANIGSPLGALLGSITAGVLRIGSRRALLNRSSQGGTSG